MKLKEANWRKLHDPHERACCKLANIARHDTIHGGAKALVIAKRLYGMGSKIPADEIVGDVYSASNYSCGEWGAYECPECGSVHLGTEAAHKCCQPDPDEEERLVIERDAE